MKGGRHLGTGSECVFVSPRRVHSPCLPACSGTRRRSGVTHDTGPSSKRSSSAFNMAPENSITVRPTPLPGHVHLVLTERQPNSFYLEIPIRVIRDACRHPPKYLFYLGWCVLGADGSLQDGQGQQVNLNGDLVDQGTYYYRLLDTRQGCRLHFFVILKLTTPSLQISSLTPLILRSSGCAATTQTLREAQPGRVSVRP